MIEGCEAAPAAAAAETVADGEGIGFGSGDSSSCHIAAAAPLAILLFRLALNADKADSPVCSSSLPSTPTPTPSLSPFSALLATEDDATGPGLVPGVVVSGRVDRVLLLEDVLI